MPMPAGALDPDAVLRAAPREAAVAALSALSREAGPAGRVWATALLLHLAPDTGMARLEALVADPSPVEVNTCLVGHRTVGDWARDALARARPPPPPPAARWWWPWRRGAR